MVMPNPAREQVWVQVSVTDKVTLLDASGRRVLAPAYRRGNAVQLDLGMLSVGMSVAVTSESGLVCHEVGSTVTSSGDLPIESLGCVVIFVTWPEMLK